MARKAPRQVALILTLMVGFFAGYLFNTLPGRSPDESADEKEASSERSDSAIRGYADALVHIRQSAVFIKPAETLQDVVASTLKAYLAEKDPYSDFLTSEEYARFKAASSHIHAGIGLDIERRRDGDMLCYPVPEGPAARAGVQPGDRLLALDGISVTGKSIPAVIALATGPAGTNIVLELEDHSGARRQLIVTRSLISFPTVSDYLYRSMRIIKLASFTPGTRRELAYMLSGWSKAYPVVIDLRSCGGGDFHAAVDTAMLFLPHGEPIVSVKTRSGTQAYSSTVERTSQVGPVFLWQGEFTASAAEVFVGALVENGRATSLGKPSAGKGTRQDVIELQNGDALVLTTGYLITPKNVQFDGKGLAPSYLIEHDSTDTDAFFTRTKELID